jgi:hypothetical protein
MKTWNPIGRLLSSHSPIKYSEVHEDDGHLPFITSPPPRTFPLRNSVVILLVVVFSSAITFISTETFRSPKIEIISVNAATSHSTLPKLSCGSSLSEAIAAGCTFDPLIFAWLHPECPRDMVDEHLEFNDGKPWDYWVDKDGSVAELIPHDNYTTLSRMEFYWTTNAEHLSHCSFMLLRFHKVMRSGGERIDGLTKSFDHAHHCLMFLMQMAEGNKDYYTIGTRGNIGFDVC